MTLVERLGEVCAARRQPRRSRSCGLFPPCRAATRCRRGRRGCRRALRRAIRRLAPGRHRRRPAAVRADLRLAGTADRHARRWGANEALRKPGQIYDSTGCQDRRAPHRDAERHHRLPGSGRGIFANETSGEYIDIAYNWLIDPNGRIYEGRWARTIRGRVAHRREAMVATSRAPTRSTTTSNTDRHRADGRPTTRSTPSARDARRADHAACVEVRAVGYRPTRRGSVSRRRTGSPRTSSTSVGTATRRRPTVPVRRSSRCCRRSAAKVVGEDHAATGTGSPRASVRS